MVAALTPRVRLMAVCDGVRESKTEAGVYQVKGLRHRLVAPAFPFAPDHLWLLLFFSSPRSGAFPGYILVIEDSTENSILYGQLTPPTTFETNLDVVASKIRLKCSFPQPGRYTIQTWFFQERGRDVLKAELPFLLLEEGA